MNDKLVQEQREKALITVDACIDRVQKVLDNADADAEFKNKALRPLQLTKQRMQASHSIPSLIAAMAELPDQEENAYDSINDLIDSRAAMLEKVNQQVNQEQQDRQEQSNSASGIQEESPAQQSEPAKPRPVIKKIVTAEPGKEVPTAQFLESEDDVKEYLKALEAKLLNEIRSGNRVRLK